jgi:uncharacterized membrane protein YagU involved in acid resistance
MVVPVMMGKAVAMKHLLFSLAFSVLYIVLGGCANSDVNLGVGVGVGVSLYAPEGDNK